MNFCFSREEGKNLKATDSFSIFGHWTRTKSLLWLPEFLEQMTGLKVGDPVTNIFLMDRNR